MIEHPIGRDAFFGYLWSGRTGYGCVTEGWHPYRDSVTGRYRHQFMLDRYHPNPARHGWPPIPHQLIDTVDMYFCPALRTGESRSKGTAADSRFAWVDIDRPLDEVAEHLEWLAEVSSGLIVVHSGSGGGHLYVPLAWSVPASEFVPLNRLLTTWLGGDHKWADNALLRLPDTLNHKGRVMRGREPDPVTASLFAGRSGSDLSGVAPTSLSDSLEKETGCSFTNDGVGIASLSPPTPFNPPRYLQRIIDQAPGDDRSAQTYHLVLTCVEHGCTDGEITWAALEHRPTMDKFATSDERLHTEVGRVLALARELHPHPGESCSKASCPNAPESQQQPRRERGNPRRGARR